LCALSSCHAEEAMKNSDANSPTSTSGKGVRYDVLFVPGGIDRVVLTKRDDARNLCFRVTLASPALDAQPQKPDLKLPSDWTFEQAIAVRDAAACAGMLPRRSANAIDAAQVTGSVRWGTSPTDGTAADLRLSFPARGDEPAFTESFSFHR
jgi:hypothetical protein